MASTLAAHQVKITIVEAQNLTRTNDWNEGSDSYCSIQLHGKVQEGTPHKTSTQKQSLSPKWNETFTVELSHSPMNDTIEVFVWGEKMLGKLFIDGWFKLLPQSVIDLSKTVTGHLHLILHYSQVQVPAPVRVPEKTKPTSSSSYPDNSPAVNCPICNRAFTALTINQHLDLCTQQPPAPTTTTTTTTKPRGEVGACPVCCKTFPIGEVDRHVESCLASQPIEKKSKRSKAVPLPSSQSEETAQLQAVLIASKLEAQKEKEKRKNEKKENSTEPLPTIEATPPPSGFAPVYPPLPYMAYPPSGMSMAPPFMPSPYMAFPDQSAQPDSTGQSQVPPMYYPPMYPPYYSQPGQPPMVGVPYGASPYSYAPTTPPTTLPPTQPPKTDLLF